MQNANIEIGVRFNIESEEIELFSGTQQLGAVEKEIWTTWFDSYITKESDAKVEQFKADLAALAAADAGTEKEPVTETPEVVPDKAEESNEGDNNE